MDKKYYSTYPKFIQFFKEIKKLNELNLVIGVNAAYGWMPTILDIYQEDLNAQLKIINNLKLNNIVPTFDEFEFLKNTFNNSIVGTSKLLHFINPEIIPIWDSRVNAYLNTYYDFNKQVNKTSKFMEYMIFCKSIVSNSDFENMFNKIQGNYGYRITKLRALEQLMFHGIKQ